MAKKIITEEYYIGQIFEGIYPPDAAVWCNKNNAYIEEIDSIEKEVEETYIEIETVEKEVVIPAVTHEEIIPAEYDEEGQIIKPEEVIVVIDEPEHTEIVVEEVPVEKTRTVVKTFRRYEIKAIPEPSEEEIKQRRIAELKAELNSTDYKIIKCSECSLAGAELPYDIVELHAQRQAIRDEINELEG